jgi:polar amino acid transport system ATP-binding protein
VAVARALIADPPILLLDEPTAAMDHASEEALKQQLREHAAGKTMIVVTHEMHFAESVSDRVLIMADGKILEQGPSAEVMRNPQTERARRFLSAVMNR